MIFAMEELFFPEQQQGINNNDDSCCWIDRPLHWRCAEMRRMENGQAALAAGIHCQAAARWRVEGGDNCSGDPHFWLEVWLLLVIMLCANGSGAPCTVHPACSSYCLAPKNLTPIIKLCTVAVQRQGQRVTLYCCSRQWRSSYPAHSLQLVIFTSFLVLLSQFSSNIWPVQSANTSPASGDIVTNLRQHWQQHCL